MSDSSISILQSGNKYIYTKEDNSDNVVRRESLLFWKRKREMFRPLWLHTTNILTSHSQLKNWSQIKVKVYAKEKEKLKSKVYYCFSINCWQRYLKQWSLILSMPNEEQSSLTPQAEAGTKVQAIRPPEHICPFTCTQSESLILQDRRTIFFSTEITITAVRWKFSSQWVRVATPTLDQIGNYMSSSICKT